MEQWLPIQLSTTLHVWSRHSIQSIETETSIFSDHRPIDLQGPTETTCRPVEELQWVRLTMSTVTALYDVQSFPLGFPGKHSNTLPIWKSYGSQSKAHLAVLVSYPKLLVPINFTFHYGPVWQSVWLCHSHSTDCYCTHISDYQIAYEPTFSMDKCYTSGTFWGQQTVDITFLTVF